jgi:hypothetical protein
LWREHWKKGGIVLTYSIGGRAILHLDQSLTSTARVIVIKFTEESNFLFTDFRSIKILSFLELVFYLDFPSLPWYTNQGDLRRLRRLTLRKLLTSNVWLSGMTIT